MFHHHTLFDKITVWPNLCHAARLAQKGKPRSTDLCRFIFNQESNLLVLQEELKKGTYRPGPYRAFRIYDPKERQISAAPYRDRVVHHALCLVIEPIFEQTFICDSYANRKGKGTHLAIKRYQYYARQYRWVLKCDIRKFFPSLDHDVLKQEIRWRIYCPKTLWLIDTIIDGSNSQEPVEDYFPGDDLFSPYQRRRGLPIGNLTSQFWANVYLNRFDHFIKETLRVPGYIRYVDDFVLFSNNKNQLMAWKKAMEDYLAGLRLKLHPNKTQLYPTAAGVPFLGFRVWPHRRIVLKEKTHRYRRFLKRKIRDYRAGKISPDQLEHALNSWLGHIRFGLSKRLEYNVFRSLREAGINVVKHLNGSWRVLELVPVRKKFNKK